MLNIGQIVYDVTNHRFLMFGGNAMFQNQETGKCSVESVFFDEEGNVEEYDDSNPTPFKYTNFSLDGKPWSGSAIKALEVGGCYFGLLQVCEEVIEAAKKAIAEAKEFTSGQGLRVYYRQSVSMGRTHPVVEIKKGVQNAENSSAQ